MKMSIKFHLPNEEITDVGVNECRFGQTPGLDREYMRDFELLQHIAVAGGSGVAQVQAGHDLTVAGLRAEVDLVVQRLAGPALETCDVIIDIYITLDKAEYKCRQYKRCQMCLFCHQQKGNAVVCSVAKFHVINYTRNSMQYGVACEVESGLL